MLYANTALVLLLIAGVAVWVRNAVHIYKRCPILNYQPRPKIRWNPFLLVVTGGWLVLHLAVNLSSQIEKFQESSQTSHAPEPGPHSTSNEPNPRSSRDELKPHSTPSSDARKTKPQSTPHEPNPRSPRDERKRHKTPLTIESVQSGCLLTIASFAVFLLLLSDVGRRPVAEFGIAVDDWRRNCMAGVAGFLAALPLTIGVSLMVRVFYQDPQSRHSYFRLLEENASPNTIAWITVTVVVLAPLSEELIFRVILQGAIRSRLPAIVSIAISSVAFIMVHGFPDMLALLPLAVVFGYVYERTHSYLAVVVMHAAFNGVMLGFALLQ